jgi:hypothetical protein
MKISLNEALQQGITKVRIPYWASKKDYIELHITPDGFFGPWAHLHAEHAIEDMPNPYEMLITNLGDMDDKCWEAYNG